MIPLLVYELAAPFVTINGIGDLNMPYPDANAYGQTRPETMLDAQRNAGQLGAIGNAHTVRSTANDANSIGDSMPPFDAASAYPQVMGDFTAGRALLSGITGLPASSSFTVMFWATATADWTGTSTRYFVTAFQDSPLAPRITVSNIAASGIFCDVRDTSGSGIGNINEGSARTGLSFSHYVLTKTAGQETRCYVNGVLIDTGSQGSDMPGTEDISSIAIGAAENYTSSLASAQFADIWIGLLSLSAGQVATLYNNGQPRNPGVDGTGYGLGRPLVLLGGPDYDWTGATLLNGGSLADFTVTGTVT